MRRALAGLAAMAALLAGFPAQAARICTYTQNPALGTEFPMRSVQAVTFTITNAATGANAGERIYEQRFRINSGSTFAAATAAPPGWTRTAYSATSVTFRATSWANAIPVGGSVAFTLMITMRNTTANVTDRLRDLRCRFTATTTGPPFTLLGSQTTATPGNWTLMSLNVTSFQITDLAGTPVTSITAGQSFRLVMTVHNVSSIAQNPIVSSPNPPTVVQTGTVSETLTGTTGSPLNLAADASGTITFTYSTNAGDNGTVRFTAIAQRSGTVTSSLASSGTLAVGRFSAGITSSAACQYVGSNITLTMALTNGYPYSILNVTPTLTPVAGAPVTYVSGPTPAAPIANVPVSPPNTNVTWVYQVNAAGATVPFTFSGSATGTGNTGGSPVHTTPTATSAAINRGTFAASISPTVVNAQSSNVEMTVTIANNGCAAVNSVGITPPAGWTGAADTYSLVDLDAVNSIETWTAAGTVFTAPNAASRMPLGFGGDFAVVFGGTPAAAGVGTFTVRVTDANGAFVDIALPVTVNAFTSGGLNDANTRIWREDFR